jgi:hypothetical protein
VSAPLDGWQNAAPARTGSNGDLADPVEIVLIQTQTELGLNLLSDQKRTMHRAKHRHLPPDTRSEWHAGDNWAPRPLTLQEAKDSDAFVVLWGEYGATIYLFVAAREIKCKENQLDDLLATLDKEDWNDFRNAGVCYVPRPEAVASMKPHHLRVGANEMWIASSLSHLADSTNAFIAGDVPQGVRECADRQPVGKRPGVAPATETQLAPPDTSPMASRRGT